MLLHENRINGIARGKNFPQVSIIFMLIRENWLLRLNGVEFSPKWTYFYVNPLK